MAKIITCVDDLQRLARRRVPPIFYDYVDGGSWTEDTYRRNQSDLASLKFRQRVGVNVAETSTRSVILGTPASLPIVLAPAGLTGMVHPDGEILAARAAKRAGVPYVLSTVSICSIEDVASDTDQPFWFQLYVMKDRDFILRLIDRAKAAHCAALVVTMDLPIQGQRHKDIRNGLSAPPRITPAGLAALMSRPRWCAQLLQTPRRSFGNIIGHAEGVSSTLNFSEWVSRQFDRTVTWDDLRWIKERWGGKLVVKGIMDVADAISAINAGADAIVVSNHGGRQLDGAPSSISVLAKVAAAVAGRAEVLLDGGIRSGQDILRALALGADNVMIARAYLYGLGASGEAGVHQCLSILARELEATMVLCGLTDVRQATPDILVNPAFILPQGGNCQ
jgi:L-lactate dehydrogenase (cytochrome)